MGKNNEVAFRPVRGTEEKILSLAYNEGYVYFATDTGNIFIDSKGQSKIPMGGRGAAVIYTNGTAVQNSDDDYYSLSVDSLVNADDTVKNGDLLINRDGSFYKVIEVLEDYFSCERIAVSGIGSGGEGGSGSTTVVTQRGRLTVTNNGETDILNGSTCTFSIKATSMTEDGVAVDDNLKVTIKYYVAGSNVAYYSDSLIIEHGQTVTYEATNYLRNSTETSISFTVSGSEANKFYSNGKVERTVITHALSLEWVSSQFSNIKYFSNTIGVSTRFSVGAKRILDVYFDDALVFTRTYAVSDTTASAAPDITKDSPIYNLDGTTTGQTISNIYTHGRHIISAVLSLAKADGTRGSKTDTITKEIGLYIDEGYPLIWFGDMDEVYYEYDNPLVPIRVYDPRADASGVKVYLYKDGADALDGSYYTISNDASRYLYWTLTDLSAGQNVTYQVRVGEDEYETWETVPEFRVEEDPRNMSIASSSLIVNFDSRARSNSESAKKRSILKIKDGKYASFEGFNWYNNGWSMDDDNIVCLRISNGAKVTLPIGAMTFAGNVPSHTIEFRMKIRNVQSYEKLITNYTRYTTEAGWDDTDVFTEFLAQRSTGYTNYDAYLTYRLPLLQEQQPDANIPSYDDLIFSSLYRDYDLKSAAVKYIINDVADNAIASTPAICLGPQDGYFSNGINAVTVDYVEDEMLNITIVYDNGTGTDVYGDNRLMKVYLNGMLTSVARSTSSTSWTINNENLIIDSKGCDIDLYKFRVYDRALGLNEILKNVAYDDTDIVAWDLSELYTANNDIGEDYQFSFNKMLTYNDNHPDDPIMPYILFTTDDTDQVSKGNLPWRKDTPIKVSMEFVNTGLDAAYANGELSEKADEAGVEVEDYYLHHCPSWTADIVNLSVQGTSSEFYPRRNYKAKTKVKLPVYDEQGNETYDEYGDVAVKSTYQMKFHKGPFATAYEEGKAKSQKWFYYDNNTVGCNKFTLKVDYMESSGSYNMGLANLVKSAYSKHPLRDYNAAKAFCEVDAANSDLKQAKTFENGTVYYYYNHKGNLKNTTDDELKILYDEAKLAELGITSEEAFNLGPTEFGKLAGQTKVLGIDATYATAIAEGKLTEAQMREYTNKWYSYQQAYKTLTIADLDDYRTSVQGFPTLAFYQTKAMKKAGTEPLFIGRYNMILDKGAAEAYGFAIDGLQAFCDNKDISDVAECWEMENNSRGYCSFRDPWNRRELSFKAPEGVSGGLTSKGAPIIADYFEYRYNALDDYIDYLYDLETSAANKTTAQKVKDKLGVDIANDIEAGRNALLDIYSNWEKAVAWVWSTATDATIDLNGDGVLVEVPSLGSYNQIDLGVAVYQPNYYYIEDASSSSGYSLCDDPEFDSTKAYFNYASNAYNEIILAADEDHLYQPSKFYTLENNNYILCEDLLIDFDASKTYYKLTEDTSHLDEAWRLPEPVVYGTTTYEYDTKEYRLAKFKNELEDHFDLEYLATYFVITEVLECYDSRGKNCMMASWGPQKKDGEYIWYPIFYDLDTQLGINNTGIPSFQYNIDATEDGTFSTNDSVLWNNFYALYKSIIIDKYEQLTGVPSDTFGTLANPPFTSVDDIEAYYSCNPDFTGSYSMYGLRPLLAFNLDEQYKYISITNPKVGYLGSGTTPEVLQDKSNTYFYALQGNRSMSRKQFLTNRLNYIDSWLSVGNYKRGGQNRIRSRISANNSVNTSDKWIEGTAINGDTGLITSVPYFKEDGKTKTHLFDGEYWIDMTPCRNMYVTVGTDAANFDSIKYSGTPVRFATSDLENGVRKSGNYREQLYYIYGLDQMKSLGDLSRLYFQEFELSGHATKMTDLKLGYDGLDEEGNQYKNSGVNTWTIPAGRVEGDTKSGMPLLKEVNLSNITFKENNVTFDLSSCEKLTNFRDTGSNITQVTFAEGVALDTLYLAASTSALSLTEARLLTDLIETYEFPVADAQGNLVAKPGLYIEGLTDRDVRAGSTNITTLDINAGSLGYNSYKLLEKYYWACAINGAGIERKVNMTDVQWSPYVRIDDPEQSYDPKAKYFIDNGHFGLEPYTDYTSVTWTQYINNGMMYEFDETIEKLEITDASLFNELITNKKFFSTSDTNNEVPNITGFVFIDNTEEVDEGEIQEQLVAKFPGLTFFFKNVKKGYSARFVVLENGIETLIGTDKISRDRYTADNTVFFTNPLDRTESAFSSSKINSLKPTKDFLGWSTSNDRTGLVESYDVIFVDALGNSAIHTWDEQELNADVYDYTFYAVFEDHYWDIKFFVVEDDETLTEKASYKAIHGSTLHDPGLLVSRDETSLAADRRYKFLGYNRKPNGNNVVSSANASVVDLTTFKATSNYNFYAVFYNESVYDSPTDLSYFDFKAATYSDAIDEDTYSVSGYMIQPKSGVTLSGKITLPSTYNGAPIVVVTGFTNQYEITHIYWYGDDIQVRRISSGAFQNCSSLKYFQTPDSIRLIQGSAFRADPQLALIDFTSMPHLYAIEDNAFAQSFTCTETVELIQFPGTLSKLGGYALANNEFEGGVECVQFGGPGDPTQLTTIGSRGYAAISQNSGNEIRNLRFYTETGELTKAIQTALDGNMLLHIGDIEVLNA